MKRIEPSVSLERDYLDRYIPSSDFKVAGNEVIVAASKEELLAYANMLEATFSAIEDWEYETRMDVSVEGARKLITQLRSIAL